LIQIPKYIHLSGISTNSPIVGNVGKSILQLTKFKGLKLQPYTSSILPKKEEAESELIIFIQRPTKASCAFTA
jgi:hypothetical protein